MSARGYIYGSGMSGCLYDYGPGYAETEDGAIDSILVVFEDCISDEEIEKLRSAIKEDGIYYFDDPGEAGAEYCEVKPTDLNYYEWSGEDEGLSLPSEDEP